MNNPPYCQEDIEIGIYEAFLHEARKPDCDVDKLQADLAAKLNKYITVDQRNYIITVMLNAK